MNEEMNFMQERSFQFSRVKQGYEPQEVDIKLNELLRQIDSLTRQNSQLNSVISKVDEKIRVLTESTRKLEAERMQENLRIASAMTAAAKSAEQTEAQARQQAEQIVAQAKQQAEQIVGDINLNIEQITAGAKAQAAQIIGEARAAAKVLQDDAEREAKELKEKVFAEASDIRENLRRMESMLKITERNFIEMMSALTETKSLFPNAASQDTGYSQDTGCRNPEFGDGEAPGSDFPSVPPAPAVYPQPGRVCMLSNTDGETGNRV